MAWQESTAVDSSIAIARLAPLLFALALALPASFAGYLTLGFCGFDWACVPDESLIFAMPCVLLSIWFMRVGPALLWIVFAITLTRFLAHELEDTVAIVIPATLLAAALLAQLATKIATYLVGDKDQSHHEPV